MPDVVRRLNNLMRSGDAPVPPAGSMMYLVAGPDQDNYEHISGLFLPYSTTATTGLSLEYREGSGWLMCEGTPYAHIMLGPEPYGTPDGTVEACAE